MRGYRVLVLVPATSFRLKDLPVEVRHLIYANYFGKSKTIFIKKYCSGEKNGCLVQVRLPLPLHISCS